MKKIILSIIAYFIVSAAWPQSSESKLVDRLVEKGVLTKEEAIEIQEEEKTDKEEEEAKISKADWVEVKNRLFNNKYLQLGGYSQLFYSYSNVAASKHDASVRYVLFSIKGEPIKNLRYLVFANLKNPTLLEYYVDWTPFEQLQFRIGQHKIPLSIENQLSLSALEFIQGTRSVNHLIGGSKDVQAALQNKGKSSGGRDVGLKMYGNLFMYNDRSIVEYNIGIYQGSGINEPAPRSNKDFIFNVLVSPLNGFRIGGGAQFGEAKYSFTPDEPIALHGRNRWIISSDYRNDNLYCRAEWIRGNDSSIRKEGLYGMFSWTFIPRWALLGKVDYYNNDKSTNIEVTDYTGGVTFFINKSCKLQANYTYADYTKKWGEKNSHLIEAMFQIIY